MLWTEQCMRSCINQHKISVLKQEGDTALNKHAIVNKHKFTCVNFKISQIKNCNGMDFNNKDDANFNNNIRNVIAIIIAGVFHCLDNKLLLKNKFFISLFSPRYSCCLAILEK